MLNGKKLQQAIRNKGYKQEVFAKEMGVGKTTVSWWINGRYEPTLPKLLQMADILEVSIDWLYDRGNYTQTDSELAIQLLGEDFFQRLSKSIIEGVKADA